MLILKSLKTIQKFTIHKNNHRIKMKNLGVIFLLYLIIPSKCSPINGSNNIDIATCNCRAYQSCKWSSESAIRISNGTQFPGEKQLFVDNICNKETQFVWCCRNGNGEEVVPTINQLATLENQILPTTTTTTTSGTYINLSATYCDTYISSTYLA